jgi:hypothetical protein
MRNNPSVNTYLKKLLKCYIEDLRDIIIRLDFSPFKIAVYVIDDVDGFLNSSEIPGAMRLCLKNIVLALSLIRARLDNLAPH